MASRQETLLVQLNARGQLTVPKEVRERLGINPGDVLELQLQGEEIVLRTRATSCIVVREVPAGELRNLEGLASIGGDALSESEALYGEPQGYPGY